MGKRFAEENFPPEIQEQAERMNTDESKVTAVELPPLPLNDHTGGTEFQTRIRPRLVAAFEKYMYGPVPPRCEELIFRQTAEGPAFGGLGIRREVDIVCRHNGMERILHLLLFLPAGTAGKVPVFFGLNFTGNHSISTDPDVTFHPFERYAPVNPDSRRQADGRFDESGRGRNAGRWDVENVLKRGYATATICYYDIYPDVPAGFEKSIMRMFYTPEVWASPRRDSGAISAWVWGIQRALDYLETVPEIDSSKMMVHGHSRLGKTALWAGANDQRIALTVSNCSGTCGAKLSHRHFGESFEWIWLWNPHWLRPEFRKYLQKDAEFPIDQHMLMAAVAPRLLYVASGSLDEYADPKGEFEAAVAASPAWRISGGSGVGRTAFPPCGQLVGNEIGYYLREGEHAVTPENWKALMDFADAKVK